jgi:hypothetical protein
MKQCYTTHLHPGMLFLAMIAVGCSRQSAPPVATSAPPVPTTAPAIATTLPATLPAGSYRVASETTFGRSDNGRLVYDPIEAGTLVVLLRADPEWSRVRTPDGKEGLIPTFRLEPKISFEAPVDPVAQLAAAPVNSFVAGPAAPPAAGVIATVLGPQDDDLDRNVTSAIRRAASYLYAQLHDDNWESVPAPLLNDPGFRGERWGTLTALTAYALNASGEARLPENNRALDWLQNAPLTCISAVGLRGQAIALWRDQKQPVIKHDAKFLMQAMIAGGPNDGLFPMNVGVGQNACDLDVSQIAVQGMAALAQMGAEFPSQVWNRAEQGWARSQAPDGTWGAAANPAGRVVPTAAGAATRVLLRDAIGTQSQERDCLGTLTDQSLTNAMEWLGHHPADALASPANLWQAERAMSAMGRRFLGPIDFYQTGAENLLRTQNPDGSWPAPPGADPAGRNIPETAYALLFLSYGRSPLVINKLDYESAPDPKTGVRHFGPGHLRSRDAAHLCTWAAKLLERPALNWKWVNFSMPPESLQEAPVLYIAGTEPLDFTPAQVDLLRNYVQRGGLIVGNADCGSLAFGRSFLTFGRQVCPRYDFREIPSDHPVLTNEGFMARRWIRPLKVLGLSNGVRELMLLIPDADLSRSWQNDSTISRSDRFQLGIDILRYASNLDWPNRGGSPLLLPHNKIVPNRTIRVARLDYLGNCDPEPGGWERLSALMHNQFATKLDVAFVKPAAGSLTRANPPFQVASLTGTGTFNLSDEARAEIAAFVNAGGTLIIDAAGGNEEFAASAEAELSAMFPPPQGQVVATVLAPKDAVYTLKAAQIDHFGYRRFVRTRLPGHLILPRVQGITVGNRLAVFFSPQDLSNGLVGQQTDGIIGYDPETATAIMRNLLLYAAGER